jgi:hypothetical protein
MSQCQYCGKMTFDIFHRKTCRGHPDYDNSADVQVELDKIIRDENYENVPNSICYNIFINFIIFWLIYYIFLSIGPYIYILIIFY